MYMTVKSPYKDHKKTYHIWYSMKWRCSQTSGHFYRFYGSRGITVCDRWLSFDNFLEDMGDKPEGLTLERVDNHKGYAPENCRWATMKEQAQNRGNSHFITIDGETLTVAQWIDKVNAPYNSTRRALHLHGEAEFIKRIKSLQE